MNDWFEWKDTHRIERIASPTLRLIAEKFVNANHSYIEWSDRPSRKMYWLLFEDSRIVGVWGLASAFDKPKKISEFMQLHNIQFNELGNNIVYCLNGQKDKNAGTKFLKLLRIDAKQWWNERYGDDLKALQCFVLPPRTGAIYKADNWTLIGQTKGKSLQVRTLTESQAKGVMGVEQRTFASGEVRYLVREYVETTPKLMFVKLIKR